MQPPRENQRFRVLVTRRVPPLALEILSGHAEVDLWESDEPIPRDELLERAKSAHGIFALVTEQIDDQLMNSAPLLKVVANMAVGYDNIDVPAATRRGIVVTNTPGVLTETTADLAWALLMATARRLPESERDVRAGRWNAWKPMEFMGRDIHGATLGIIGMGRIGAATARRALGFGMRVIYHNRRRNTLAEAALGCEYVELDTLLAESDFVSLHCPLTEETRGLIGERELRLMKETAILINTSRGAVVDEAALIRALRERTIWAAGLDVYTVEPIGADHPLLELDNVVALPHIGSASIETRTTMAQMAAENILAVLRGEKPRTPLNWDEVHGSE